MLRSVPFARRAFVAALALAAACSGDGSAVTDPAPVPSPVPGVMQVSSISGVTLPAVIFSSPDEVVILVSERFAFDASGEVVNTRTFSDALRGSGTTTSTDVWRGTYTLQDNVVRITNSRNQAYHGTVSGRALTLYLEVPECASCAGTRYELTAIAGVP